MQKPIINFYQNPFKVSDKKTTLLDSNVRFIDYLQKVYPKGFSRPTSVLLNGLTLKVDDFDIMLSDGDVIDIKMDPMATTVGANFATGGAVRSGFRFLTGPIIDFIVPLPDIPELPTALKVPRQSATYNLRAQSNLSRLNEAIPTQYGKVRWYPDLAAIPWFENNDNDRFLNQLFILGWGELDIETIRLGDTLITDFAGLEFEVYGPNEEVTLFHDNNYTSPLLRNFDVFQSGRFNRFDNDFDFDEPNKKIVGPVGTNFNEMVQPGDTVLIECDTAGFEGDFVVDTVSDTEIVFDDVTSWPGSDLTPGFTTVYDSSMIQYLFPGFTDDDYLVDVGTRLIFMGYSQGYITSPVGTESDIFYFDIDFPGGIYNDTSGDFENQTASFQALFRPIEDDGSYSGVVTPTTGQGMDSESGDNITWHASDTSQRQWDSTASFTFYDNGVPISGGDISVLDFGGPFGGAKVTFTGAKTGPLTYDGTYITMPLFSKTVSVTRSTPIAQRVTLTYDMSAVGGWVTGRFRVFIGRSNGYTWNDENRRDNGRIIALKTKLDKVGKYGPYTLLAVRIKATPDITTGNARKINVVATRKLLIWNGSAWTGPTATRSIAWALADLWMSSYAASRSTDDLDKDALLALDATFTSRGDTFDGVFDSAITVWEALTRVGQAGRTKPIFDGTTLTFVRDDLKTVFTAMFNPENMLPDSFSIQYNFADNQTPDGFEISYFDEDANYQPARVRSAENLNLVKVVDFFGCVNYEQAFRESQYLAARLQNEGVVISFSTEMTGHIPFYGDLISVQYDLPDWGQGGRVEDKTGTTITTSQPLDFSGSAPFLMGFMRPNGSVSGPHIVTQGSGENEAILAVDVTDFTFITALTNQNPTIYQFGPSTNWNKSCIVTKVTPKDDNETLGIECRPFVEAVHTADEATPPAKPGPVPTNTPVPPKVSGLILTNVPGSGSVIATWNPQIDIDNYKVQKSTDNIVFTDVSTPTVTTETIAATGTLYVRVASVIGATIGEYSKQVIVAS